jgi:hypothetical protein
MTTTRRVLMTAIRLALESDPHASCGARQSGNGWLAERRRSGAERRRRRRRRRAWMGPARCLLTWFLLSPIHTSNATNNNKHHRLLLQTTNSLGQDDLLATTTTPLPLWQIKRLVTNSRLLAGELSLLLLPQPAWLTDPHFPFLLSQEEKKKKRNSNCCCNP